MNNLDLYEKGRAVPETAKKPIGAGRLKGKTDINPMWRIKKLTEMFGPCGVGWWYEIIDKVIIDSPDTKEKAAFVDIKLFYIDVESGEASNPIYGTGGSMFVTNESSGLHVSDECFKMALTDAISVAAKALGIGADVYWDKDKTKYSGDDGAPQQPAKAPEKAEQPKQEQPKAEAPKEVPKAEQPKKKPEQDDEIKALRAELNKKAKEIMSVTGFDSTKVNKILCDKCSINKPIIKEDYQQLLIAAGVMLGELYDRKD